MSAVRVDLTFQLRRGTTAEWAAANPVLLAGEPGVDLTTGEQRIGDGVTAWADLSPVGVTSYAALTGKPTLGTAAAADATDFVRTATLDLPVPAYIAHRGGAGVAPEETMEAFRTAVANGADVLDMDCQPLGDGALGLMHDTTVDRTTDGTGNASGFTAPSWRTLNAAAKFPWNGRVLPPALLSEVIAEFGGKVPIMVEPKDQTNAGQIMDMCDAAGIKGSVVLAASALAVLQTIKARGYACYFWWGGAITPVTAAQAVAEGADYLGLDGVTRPESEVSELVATGLPVMPYTINRRSDKARLLALGVAGFLTDHPAYLRGATAMRTVDSWRQGVLGQGFVINCASPDYTTVSVTSQAAMLAQQGTPINAIPGEVCPLANAAGSYTINVDIGFATLPAAGGSVVVLFGMPDDSNRSMSGAADSFPDGYLALMRATGGLSLYRVPKGAGAGITQLGSTATTAALTAGGYAHLTIVVTPTQITVTRTDSAGTIGPVTDATHRGGYIALGKKDVIDGTVRFKALAIT